MAWAFGATARHSRRRQAGEGAADVRQRVAQPPAGPTGAGDYPSGGPSGGSSTSGRRRPPLDLLAPDIYVDDVKPVLDDYARPDNPLFVPESRVET